MRFPLSMTTTIARYILRKRPSERRKAPLVLMLEPLFTCNLHCAGCGRIREYADFMTQKLTLDECLQSAQECGSPVVSICGGEPLIYPEIGELVRGLTQTQRRYVYLCTNGLCLEKHIQDKTFEPSKRFFINVHLDGLAENHDASTGRPGTFDAAVAGIRAAVAAGFQVCTNTTLYKESSVDEIVELCTFLESIGVGGLMLAPAYSYEAFDSEAASGLFLTTDEIHEKFRELERRLRGHKMTATPLYMDFLTGRRKLPCAAWANPTRNVCGWKAPCYLLTDGHYATYQEMLDNVQWETLGPDGTDPRCKNCMMHSGFEPGAVLVANRNILQGIRVLLWQLGLI